MLCKCNSTINLESTIVWNMAPMASDSKFLKRSLMCCDSNHTWDFPSRAYVYFKLPKREDYLSILRDAPLDERVSFSFCDVRCSNLMLSSSQQLCSSFSSISNVTVHACLLLVNCLFLLVPRVCQWSATCSICRPVSSGKPITNGAKSLVCSTLWFAVGIWYLMKKDPDTDILYLNVAGTSLVVLDTSEAAMELLEKRSSIYSGRSLLFVWYTFDYSIFTKVKQGAHAYDEWVDGMELPLRFYALRCVIHFIHFFFLYVRSCQLWSKGEHW